MLNIKKTITRLAKQFRHFFLNLKQQARHFWKQPNARKFSYLSFIIIFLLIIANVVLSFIYGQTPYKLGKAEALLSPVSHVMANKISYDALSQSFNFNAQGTSDGSDLINASTTVKSTAYKNASKGVTVVDPVNNIDFTLTPKYKLDEGKQSNDRIIYPISDNSGWTVYTMQATGVKEDILLNKKTSDKKTFEYSLNLSDGLEARMETDGGIGVYGNPTLSSDITTATSADALLLQKARLNSTKTTLLFSIPKPIIVESGGKKSKVQVAYSLNGNSLNITASNLNQGSYPLSIDPSIYVSTAQQFMAGNNETNINFNVDNKLIEKAHTTGARFNSWNPTKDLNNTMWRQGVAVAGGYIYTVGGTHPEGGIASYTTPGTDTFVVPAGVNSISVKAWGGGGGGGGGGNGTNSTGGNGGGGGFVQTTLTVTPGETLNIAVGGGGGFGGGSTRSGEGGGGGGYSRVSRSSTSLLVAAGGAGGGGGGNSSYAGGDGGAGGGTTGIIGSDGSNAPAGDPGTPSGGGAGGNSSRNDGANGGSLSGGDGADGRSSSGSDGSNSNGGSNGGGNGGSRDINNSYAGAGGGGGGYYGGGGGSSSGSSNRSAGGGGGGSSYTTGTGATNTAGSGTTPGNSTDSDIGASAVGGSGGARRGDGTSGSSGSVIISYTTDVSSVGTVSWARFNTTSGEIENTNPGNGTCSGWCTSTAYKLPAPRSNLSLVAYNGFLYAIGGEDPSCTTANGTGDGGICKTVYVAKIGANGEPRLWHPTDTNQNNWTYWYRAGDLTNPRSISAAVASNNHMYLLGGKTSSGGVVSVTNTVQIADIIPTGALSNWTTSSANLPTNSYGHGVEVYNDRMYLIGGASAVGSAPTNNVFYIKINNDGTLNNWIQTSSFATGRLANGGNFTTVWGGYLYISGGCSAVNGSGYCTSISDDTQLASINADGSLDIWNTNASVSDQRTGHNLVSWRNYIYEIGGCSSQNPTTGVCLSPLQTINYGVINQDGDASTVDQSVSSGTAPCNGGSPHSCNLPGTSYIGNMLTASFITGGYLYVVGGCTNNSCSNTIGNVSYVAISSTGLMTKPATCPTGTYQGNIWCVDTTNTISGGIAASSPVVFGNVVYLVGGLNGSGNVNAINRATINSDGSLSAWTSQSMTGLGVNSVSYLFAYSRSNPVLASTAPGNLYIFGGCTASSNAGCTGYSQNVYKCNILINTSISSCSTSGQMNIGVVPGDSSPGLGIMSGTVYANYIYLIGGVSPNITDLSTVRYAKFDNNNNVVAADGGSSWIESPNKMEIGRRRAAAFGYNGYIYAMGGYDGSSGSVLADIEFIKVNVSDGSLGSTSEGFHVSAVTINQRWGLSVPISNSFAYIIGGCTVGASPSGCTTRTDTIQTFQIYNNDSGAPAGYSTSTNTYGTNPNRIGASSTILNGYIYVAGGCTSTTDCTATTSNVSYAKLDANGNIGSWTSTASLPSGRAWGKLENAGGSLYYIGGQDNAAAPKVQVYYATPSSGAIPSWQTTSHGLPVGLTKFGATTWNNRLYVTGNFNAGPWDSTYTWDTGDINTRATWVSAVYDRGHTGSSTHVLAPIANGVNSYDANGNLEWSYSGLSGGYDIRDIAVGNLEGTGYNDTTVLCSGYYAGTGNYLAILDKDGNQIQLIATPSDDSRCDKVVIDGTDIYVGSTLGVTKYVKSGSTWSEDTVNWHKNLGGDTLDMQINDAGNGKRLYLTNRSSSMVYAYQTNGTLDWSSSTGNYTGDLAIGKTDSSKSGKQIVVTYQGGAKVFDKDGNLSDTLSTGSNVRTGVTLYDENGDGQDEIYISDMGQDLYAWARTGTNTYSVKYSLLNYLNSGKYAGLTHFDIEGTGQDDIIAGSTDGYVYVISPDLSSIKKTINVGHGQIGRFDGNYAMLTNIQFADLSGDGLADMVIPGGNGYVDVYTIAASINTNVFISPQLNSGGDISGTWSTDATPLNVPRSGATLVAYANNLYVIGGNDGSNYLSDVQYAQLNTTDGTVGNWSYSTSLPGPISQADGFAANGYIYLIGGRTNSSTCSPSTLVAPISANTTIASGNHPTGIGEWYETNQAYSGDRYGAAAVYSDGKAYVLGGACGSSTLTYASPVIQQTTLLSQPQVAKYSLMVDTDTDVFPRSWLLNGVDNSIGAFWQLKTRSMTNTTTSCTSPAMTTWGQETNFGNVVLGTPGIYTPKNGSGVNTNCARFYYFSIAVDSTQAYGYPDDVTRGPTITDLTLQFAADPSKRLMHGRTFTGGLQQPVDTPYYTN